MMMKIFERNFEKNFEKSYNVLTSKLMDHFCARFGDENIVFSLYSFILLLGMTAHATVGKCRKEILDVLGELRYEDLLEDVWNCRKVIEGESAFTAANAVLVRNGISLREGYEESLSREWKGKLFQSNDLIGDVNRWAKSMTEGMIDKVADESMKEAVLCLINAVSFNGKWQEPYENSDICDREFVTINGTAQMVPMLSGWERDYLENQYFTGFLKPYKGGCSFLALLPKKKGRHFLHRALKNLDIAEIIKRKQAFDVHVTMPEFKTENKHDLSRLCKEMGMTEVFGTHADFSPLSDEWLMLDRITQAAKIEVDRNGTKAAAVTAAICDVGAAPDFDRIRFVDLNRPFVYAIVENKTGLPIFAGMVNKVS